MNKNILDNIFHDLLNEIHQDENFTDDFKKFSKEAMIINKLCNTFEEGTGRQITNENIFSETGVFHFIKDFIPLIGKIGLIITVDDKTLEKLIKLYLLIKQTNKIN